MHYYNGERMYLGTQFKSPEIFFIYNFLYAMKKNDGWLYDNSIKGEQIFSLNYYYYTKEYLKRNENLCFYLTNNNF